jgi:hypothetical protein
MKMEIRQSVFETNSSSTHSMTIYYESDWKAFERGELNIILDKWDVEKEEENENEESNEEIYTIRSLPGNLQFVKPGEEVLNENEICLSYAQLIISGQDDLEESVSTFITKSGEKVIIECEYGYNG